MSSFFWQVYNSEVVFFILLLSTLHFLQEELSFTNILKEIFKKWKKSVEPFGELNGIIMSDTKINEGVPTNDANNWSVGFY